MTPEQTEQMMALLGQISDQLRSIGCSALILCLLVFILLLHR